MQLMERSEVRELFQEFDKVILSEALGYLSGYMDEIQGKDIYNQSLNDIKNILKWGRFFNISERELSLIITHYFKAPFNRRKEEMNNILIGFNDEAMAIRGVILEAKSLSDVYRFNPNYPELLNSTQTRFFKLDHPIHPAQILIDKYIQNINQNSPIKVKVLDDKIYQNNGDEYRIVSFFSRAATLLEEALNNIFPDDSELFSLVQQKNYTQFQELKRNRGMNHNLKNSSLIKVLSNQILFYHLSKRLNEKNDINSALYSLKKEYFDMYQELEFKATCRGLLDRNNSVMESIDYISITRNPHQLVTQSTYKNWRSCMEIGDLYYHDIAYQMVYGSLMAYGYSKKNPMSPLCRISINPFFNQREEKVYVPCRIYGLETKGFLDEITEFTDRLNAGKKGIFFLPKKIYKDAENVVLKLKNDEELLEELRNLSRIELRNTNLSQFNRIEFPGENKSISLCNIVLNDDVSLVFNNHQNLEIHSIKFSKKSKISFKGEVDNIEFHIFNAPEDMDLKLKQGSTFVAAFSDFSLSSISGFDELEKLDLRSVSLPDKVEMNLYNLEEVYLNRIDMCSCSNVVLPQSGKRVSIIETKLPNGTLIDLSNPELYYENCDFSNCIIHLPKGDYLSLHKVKMPEIDFSDSSFKKIKWVEADIYVGKSFIWSGEKEEIFAERTYFPKGGIVDLSETKKVCICRSTIDAQEFKLPDKGASLIANKIKVKKLDLSNVMGANLNGCDLSKVDELILPKDCSNIQFSEVIFPEGKILDLRNVEVIDLRDAMIGNCLDILLPADSSRIRLSPYTVPTNFKLRRLKEEQNIKC